MADYPEHGENVPRSFSTMQNTRYHLRSAPIAIAAMLALGTTPGSAQTAPTPTPPAQTAEPIVLQLPVDAPTAPVVTTPAPKSTSQPTSQPTIVLDVPPAEQAEPTVETRQSQESTSAPVAERTSQPREPAGAARETDNEPAAQTTVPASTSSVTSERSAPPAPDTGTSLPAEAEGAPPVIAAPVPAAEAVAPEPVPAAGPGWTAIIALALVGIIPLSLAFLAFAWFRRRSRRTDGLQVETAEVVATEPVPVANPTVDVAPARAAIESEPVRAPISPARGNPLDTYRGLPSQGAAVALPAQLPETFEERDALLKQMIAAKPDRANPFRSGKARAKRARLILQSLGRKFENVKPRIDLSQYTANWPALARKRTAYA